MTSADRFDRRLESSVVELAAPRFPDYFDDILAVTSRTRQRPAWTFPGRWIPMADISRQRAIAPAVPWRALGVLVTILLVVLLAVATIVGSQRRLPTPFGPARNGSVLRVDNAALYAIDPATGESRLLIADANNVGGSTTDSPAYFDSPAYSLDGTHLAFFRTHSGTQTDLFVSDADGSHPVRLNAEPLVEAQMLAWSPDGRSIAIGLGDDPNAGRVAIAHPDRTGITLLDLGMPLAEPAWRPPDGRDLLVRGVIDDAPRLFLVHPDGTGLRPLGAPGSADRYDLGQGAWSPDGTRIAYLIDQQDPYQARVHAIKADGSGHVVLSVAPQGIQDYRPVWSPDGRSIAVFRWRYSDGNTSERWVAVIPSDGSGPGAEGTNLVRGASGGEWGIAWSPDGTRVLAVNATTQQVVSIDPATGATTTLPWTSSQAPSWQRLAP